MLIYVQAFFDYPVNVGTYKRTAESKKPRKSRLLIVALKGWKIG